MKQIIIINYAMINLCVCVCVYVGSRRHDGLQNRAYLCYRKASFLKVRSFRAET